MPRAISLVVLAALVIGQGHTLGHMASACADRVGCPSPQREITTDPQSGSSCSSHCLGKTQFPRLDRHPLGCWQKQRLCLWILVDMRPYFAQLVSAYVVPARSPKSGLDLSPFYLLC